MTYTEKNAEDLIRAIRDDDAEAVRKALQVERVNAPIGSSAAEHTPLRLAVSRGCPHAARVLLELGADPNLRVVKSTLLSEAVQYLFTMPRHDWPRLVDCCRVLLEHGADPNAPEAFRNWTPLHRVVNELSAGRASSDASARAELAMGLVRMLVERGADPHWSPPRAEAADPATYLTPFQHAVRHGHEEAVQYFIDECGANFGEKTMGGRSLAQLATKPVMKDLLRSSASVRAVEVAVGEGRSTSDGTALRSSRDMGML